MSEILFDCPECKSPLKVDESGSGMVVDAVAGSTAQPPPPPTRPGDPRPGASIPVFKNEPILVLILGFVTCGLYLIYWNIKMAEVLNAVAGRTVIAPVAAILSGCCVPVNVYYYYLAGGTLTQVGALIGKPDLKDKSTMMVLLGIFFPMVAVMILRGIYEKKA
jgi:hypothetical protein